MEGFAYFPTIIYRDEKPEFVETLRNMCLQQIALVAENNKDRCIVQTNDLLGLQEFEFVKTYLLQSGINILQDQGYDTNLYNFYVSNLWAQEVKPGAGTDIHIHKYSQISGWIFINTPENGSVPVFYDPRLLKEMIELQEYRPDMVTNATSIINFGNVKPGTIIFNNSWLKHQLSLNNSSLSTLALHFMISYENRKDILCNI